MKKPGTSARAIAILVAAAGAAFAISTAAVSSATTSLPSTVAAVKYPFAKFSLTGGVATGRPAKPATFSLTFAPAFTLAANSPGLTNPATGTLANVTITEQVSYPVPGGSFVGPVRLPFRSETLVLTVGISGKCFTPLPSGGYGFNGKLSCVTSKLKLGPKTYKVSALLKTVRGTFMTSPAGAQQWTGSFVAVFANPGYTFPVATLGAGGFTSLTIGGNGGKLPTRSITFAG